MRPDGARTFQKKCEDEAKPETRVWNIWERTWAQYYKTFYVCNLRVFTGGLPQSGAPERCFTQVVSEMIFCNFCKYLISARCQSYPELPLIKIVPSICCI